MVREPQQFKHPPLAGLWKQHYFQASFLAKNLESELNQRELSGPILTSLADAINEGVDHREALHELVIGGYERRAARARLTGEWIVYAKDAAGQNFFLTLARHRECEQEAGESEEAWQRRSDTMIYERVLACRSEFPELGL